MGAPSGIGPATEVAVGGSDAPDESKIPSMIEEIRQVRSELAVLCLRHNVRRLDLFGSAVGTDFDPATGVLDDETD